MSMREYGVSDYGLILTEEALKAILKRMPDFSDKDDCDEIDGYYYLYEKGMIEYVSEFSGSATEIADDGSFCWCGNSIYYSGNNLYYIPLNNYPTLLKPAYSSIDAIVGELKQKLGNYLPDYDYRKYIRHICGTYFG